MAGKQRKTTMADVAREAGVSIATVSQVLRKSSPVSEKTADAVLQAVRRLGYRRTDIGSDPSRSRRMIGFFLPKDADSFHVRAMAAAARCAGEDGWSVIFCSCRPRIPMEDYCRRLKKNGVCGLCFLSQEFDDETLRTAAAQFPTVLMGRPMADRSLDAVEIDPVPVVFDLVRRLAGRGVRRIGFFGTDAGDPYQGPVCTALLRALEKYGLERREEWFRPTRLLRFDRGRNSRDLILAQLRRGFPLPEVCLCSDDETAAGLMRGLREGGVRVPEDMGVVGFGDHPFAPFLSPSLTTLGADAEELGRQCFLRLRERIRFPAQPVRQVVSPCTLVRRSSLLL